MKIVDAFKMLGDRLFSKLEYYDETNLNRQAAVLNITVQKQIVNLCTKHFATLAHEVSKSKLDIEKCDDLAFDIAAYMLRLIENNGDTNE